MNAMLICVDLRFKRNLNPTRKRCIGNLHVTHFCSTHARAVHVVQLLKQLKVCAKISGSSAAINSVVKQNFY